MLNIFNSKKRHNFKVILSTILEIDCMIAKKFYVKEMKGNSEKHRDIDYNVGYIC